MQIDWLRIARCSKRKQVATRVNARLALDAADMHVGRVRRTHLLAGDLLLGQPANQKLIDTRLGWADRRGIDRRVMTLLSAVGLGVLRDETPGCPNTSLKLNGIN